MPVTKAKRARNAAAAMAPRVVICDYCGRQAKLLTGREVYPHRPDLFRLRFYDCAPCDARVGCHEGTAEPKGRLANAELRRERQLAHKAFDPLWERRPKAVRLLAYSWLALALDIPVDRCHIAMMDVADCRRVVIACNGPKDLPAGLRS